MKRYRLWLTAVASLALLVALFSVVGIAAAQDDGIDVGGVESLEGVNNEAETCVDGSCNTGNVVSIEVEPGCIIIVAGLGAATNLVTGDGEFATIDQYGEMTPVDPAQVDVDEFLENAIIINDVCNTEINVNQSQGGEEKIIERVVQQEAAAKGAALPVTGAPALALGLLGSGLSTAGLALWRRRS